MASAPRSFPDHVYLGAFTSSGVIVVADPCQVDDEQDHGVRDELFPFSRHIGVRPGRWHCYARVEPETEAPLALFALHESRLDGITDVVYPYGEICVDSGTVCFIDDERRRGPGTKERIAALLAADDDATQGMLALAPEGAGAGAAGCFSFSGGDGRFDVVGEVDDHDECVLIRVRFTDEDDHLWLVDTDTAVHRQALAHSPAPAEVRPYSPAAVFRAGERIEHERFGVGRVAEVDGRSVTVLFDDRARKLVHAR